MDALQEIIRDFLESRKALAEKDLQQTSGFRITHRYADLMDRFIRSLFLEAGFRDKISKGKKDGLVLLALGSYGRRELCFESDVDLMVIHQGRLSPEMSGIITRAIYPLWDAKLEVGHSVLTVQECIRLSRNDFRVLTSVMDARFLLGSRSFYRLFDIAFRSRIDREKESLLKDFLIHQEKREEKYDSENYFVEPDIKEGLGGLRDLHFMAWMAKAYFKCERLSQIRRFAVFSHFGLDKLSHSRGFLLKVRNHLHLLAGRKDDRLLLSYQKKLSHILGYKDGRQITALERFMKDLYLHLNRIRYGYDEFRVKALDIINPSPLDVIPERLPPEFQVMKGNVVLKNLEALGKRPLLILMAFHEANRCDLSLGSELIWEARRKILREGKTLVNSPEARRLFLDMILKPTNPKVIRLALEIGLISLFIPEFKRIRNLAQLGFYHVKTVDLHSLATLEVINEISTGVYDEKWPLFKEVFNGLKYPDRLFLAGLLHDIGKGSGEYHPGRGAELIPGILGRLDISGDAIDVVSLLVKHHLLLMRVSQRRDLGEEKTAVLVAQAIQNEDTLNMLLLLSVADSIATGPIARSEWKIMLLIELFFKVRHILEKGVLASPDATKKIKVNKESIMAGLGSEFSQEEILELMDQVASRYFLNTPLEDMIEHFRLALTMGEERLSWTLRKLRDAPVTRIILCTYDRPGLFSKMVGVFALNNIKVLLTNIFTLKNGLAFDVYEVTNPLDPYREEERWNRIKNELGLALEDRLPLDEMIQKKRRMALDSGKLSNSETGSVRVDNEASDFFTVIEVGSQTTVGLLYDLAVRISSLDLDIRFAKINSDEERMTGVFYIRDSGGQKIYDEDQISRVKQEIFSVMG